MPLSQSPSSRSGPSRHGLAGPAVLSLLAGLVGLLAAAGCEREALPEACPTVSPGELVLTEIRGAQSGTSDTLGQWVELYNTTGRTIDLAGLGLRLRKLDGSSDVTLLVRSVSARIAPGGYAVLGRFAAGSEPGYVTYGYLADFSANLYSAGALDLEACGVSIDRVRYASLPGQGTLSLDGARTPDATANDDAKAWCVDAAGADHPGTPLERNHPCSP